MEADEYQEFAAEITHDVKGYDSPPLHFFALGLTEEAGEFAGKVKKAMRGDYEMQDRRVDAALELGDVMWYLANAANELGYSLSDIMEMNIKKLTDRRDRGVMQGDGDNR